MTLELVEKTDAEVAAWLPGMRAHYIDARVEAGEPRSDAESSADQQFAVLVPEGRAAPGQHVMNVLRDGEQVGLLWMGQPLGARGDMWFVFFVEVDESHRGEGLGRATMLAAEEWARANGGSRIGLSVFGQNTVARSLYVSLGYETAAISMIKDLSED